MSPEPKVVDVENNVTDNIEFDLDNNTVYIKAKNPHGFYWVSLKRGNLPEKLKGAYTSRFSAEKEVRGYYEDQKNRTLAKA